MTSDSGRCCRMRHFCQWDSPVKPDLLIARVVQVMNSHATRRMYDLQANISVSSRWLLGRRDIAGIHTIQRKCSPRLGDIGLGLVGRHREAHEITDI